MACFPDKRNITLHHHYVLALVFVEEFREEGPVPSTLVTAKEDSNQRPAAANSRRRSAISNQQYPTPNTKQRTTTGNSNPQQPSPAVFFHRRRQRGRRGRAGCRVLDADQGYPHALQLRREVGVEAESVIRTSDALALICNKFAPNLQQTRGGNETTVDGAANAVFWIGLGTQKGREKRVEKQQRQKTTQKKHTSKYTCKSLPESAT